MTPAGHRPAWSASPSVSWKSADALSPLSYEETAKSCDAVVHTVGILLESRYKGADGGSPSQIWQGLTNGWRGGGGNDGGNPLKREAATTAGQAHSEEDQMSYNRMNRDAALTVARTFSSTRAQGSPSPFVYISAEDIFRPIISPRYIESKREAEQGISAIAQEQSNTIRPVFLRPGE